MTQDAPAIGSIVGPWLILERLGSGNFGTLYKAQRAGLPHSPLVALKMARNPQDPRFPREATLLQCCPHSSIPHYESQGVWTSPEDVEYPYIVMEWVEGLSLYDWHRQHPHTSREVLHVLAQVASALAAAHANSAVHRDVKGGNIRVTSAMVTVSAELEALIVRLLSEDPKARGTAEQTARDAAALVRAAGPEVDRPILPAPSAQFPKEGAHSSEPSASDEPSDSAPASSRSDTPARGQQAREAFYLRLVASWAAAAIVGGLVVGMMLKPSRPLPSEPESFESAPWIATPEERQQFAPDAGVSEEALSTAHDVPQAVVPHFTVGRPVLKKPLPGQRRPPCGFGETPINGGCWVEVGRVKPPCGDTTFEHQGYCYVPSFDEQRQPTSDEP